MSVASRAAKAWPWVAALALGWLVVAAAYVLQAAELRSPRFGVAYQLGHFDQWLALLGLGIAVSPLRPLIRWGTLAGAIAAAVAGFMLEGRAAPLVFAPVAVSGTYLPLIGPAACIAAAAGLALPQRVRAGMLWIFALAIGGAWGLLLALNDPALQGFIPGAAAVALLFVLTGIYGTAAAAEWSGPRPTRIATRIFASWLTAVALLLTGAELLAKPRLNAGTVLRPPAIAQVPGGVDVRPEDNTTTPDPFLPDPNRQP